MLTKIREILACYEFLQITCNVYNRYKKLKWDIENKNIELLYQVKTSF